MLSLSGGVAAADAVGGKAASLMKLYSTPGVSGHVPAGFALSVDFFSGWVDAVLASRAWADAEPKLLSADAAAVCGGLKELAKSLPLSQEQRRALDALKGSVRSWPGGLAAVRSSAPEEDGSGASFAGVFETRLGVTAESLEAAVRDCFASVFDHRAFSYAGAHRPAFAAVVMEMVDSYTAGVAFSANPLNSDLDEMVVDSSWGLGESVVDGSVVADRFVWDKVQRRLVEKTVGSKAQERRLCRDGGVDILPVDEQRQAMRTLSDAQLAELADLVCLVEKTYGMPMDTEWAHTDRGELKLLQARPITTIHPLDENMITPPGQPRVLYYDYNVASEATTTSPFTHMDLDIYSDIWGKCMRDDDMHISEDPSKLIFNGATRQFCNFSHVLKFFGTSWFSSNAEMVDPYLAAILRSDDLNRDKYRTKKLPPQGLSLRRTWTVMRSMWSMNKAQRKWSDPLPRKREFLELYREFDAGLRKLEQRGATEGLQRYHDELWKVLLPLLDLELGAVMGHVLPIFQELDRARRTGASAKEREEADALCGGYEGDDIMEINIAMYGLAQKLPGSVWSQYRDDLPALAARIGANLAAGGPADLPEEFLEAWRDFMDRYGWDGSDQLFVSSPRYADAPATLLSRVWHSVGDSVKDPAISQQEKIAKRREVMARQEAEAASGCFGACRLPKLRLRNQYLEHVMNLRNSPKLHMSRVVADLRYAVLRQQEQLLKAGRLDQPGDIFHLSLAEADLATRDPSFDARAAAAPRKTQYNRARKATSCPMLIDSRCRILRPNPARGGEPGTLVGAAISPGVATGRVRVLAAPTERLEAGEVLATVVTDPAWTPLFAGCAAVVLQVGGALQHGALCAREFGKPAVSGIDVAAELRTGMLVSVDGNTGVVKILDEPARQPAGHLSREDPGASSGAGQS